MGFGFLRNREACVLEVEWIRKRREGPDVRLVSDNRETEKFYSQCGENPLDCFEQEKEVIRPKFVGHSGELTRGARLKAGMPFRRPLK